MCRIRLEALDLGSEEDIEFLFITRCHPSVSQWLFGKSPPDLETHKAWLVANVPHQRLMYLLKLDDLPAGYCHAYNVNLEEKSLEAGFVIHPNFQGHGLGKAMVQLFYELLSEKYPGWKVSLKVRVDNKVALGLYERHGFIRVGEVDGIVMMEKSCEEDDVCM